MLNAQAAMCTHTHKFISVPLNYYYYHYYMHENAIESTNKDDILVEIVILTHDQITNLQLSY